MPGTLLLRLQNESNPGALDGGSNPISFIPNDCEHVGRLYQARGRSDNVFQERAPANFM